MSSPSPPEQPWKQLKGLSRLIFSFRVAFQGIRIAIRTQQNFRLHLLAAGVIVGVSGLLHVTLAEWLTIVACTGAVLSAELFNTAIEQLVDLACPEIDPRAGAVKDLSAAAVLIVCLTAALIGLLVLAPKLLSVLHSV